MGQILLERRCKNPAMKIALESSARKITFLVACLVLTLVYIGLSAREFVADSLSRKLDLRSLRLAARLEPGNAEYQYLLGHNFLQMQHEPETAAQFLRSATTLNPYNASYWLELSRTYWRLGNFDQQKVALQRALAADPSTPNVAWEAANIYWGLGDTDNALREFRFVLEHDPYLSSVALDRCWQLKPDVDALLRDVIPHNPAVYSTFLSFLISKNQPDAATKVWAQMVQLQQTVETRYVFEYVRYLIGRRAVAQAQEVWHQAANLSDLSHYQPWAENRVINGDFGLPLLNAGFDWLYEKSPDISLELDPTEPHLGQRSLSIVFDSRGIEDAGIRQLIPVEPNTKYAFSAYFKSKDLAGAGGPRFVLEDQFTGINYFASDSLKDAPSWTRVYGTFNTGPDAQLLVLRIQRVPPGNAIRGRLWIDGIRLAQFRGMQNQSMAGGK